MLPFYILFGICILLSIFKRQKFANAFVPLLLFLFSFLRGNEVGTDTLNYMNPSSIQWLADSSVSDAGSNIKLLEISYISIVKLAYLLDYPRLIISFFSIITFLFLYKSFSRMQLCQGIAFTIFLLLGLYTSSLNYARQFTACSILLYSFTFYLIDNNKIKSIFWILIASTFHISSIFYSILIFIPNIKLKRNFVIMFLSGFFLLSTISPINIISLCAKFISMPYLLRYEHLFMASSSFSLMGALFKLMNYSILLFIFYRSNNSNYLNRFDLIFFISCIFIALFSSSDPILARITIGMSLIQASYISKYFSRARFQGTTLLIYLIFTILQAYSVLVSIANGTHELIPYKFL